MPYTGSNIESLFSVAKTQASLRQMAHTGAERMTELTVQNTPIDTGNLRTSWSTKPVKREVRGIHHAYVSGTETSVFYAPYVEHGTGLWGPKGAYYEIKPKKPGGVLSFSPRNNVIGARFDLAAGRYRPSVASLDASGQPSLGERVFVRRVMHPGSPGQHMVATAAAMVEATLDTVLAADLREWAKAIEAGV